MKTNQLYTLTLHVYLGLVTSVIKLLILSNNDDDDDDNDGDNNKVI